MKLLIAEDKFLDTTLGNLYTKFDDIFQQDYYIEHDIDICNLLFNLYEEANFLSEDFFK